MKVHHVRDEHEEVGKDLGLGFEVCRLRFFG